MDPISFSFKHRNCVFRSSVTLIHISSHHYHHRSGCLVVTTIYKILLPPYTVSNAMLEHEFFCSGHIEYCMYFLFYSVTIHFSPFIQSACVHKVCVKNNNQKIIHTFKVELLGLRISMGESSLQPNHSILLSYLCVLDNIFFVSRSFVV